MSHLVVNVISCADICTKIRVLDFKMILVVMMLLALPFSAESGKRIFDMYSVWTFRSFTSIWRFFMIQKMPQSHPLPPPPWQFFKGFFFNLINASFSFSPHSQLGSLPLILLIIIIISLLLSLSLPLLLLLSCVIMIIMYIFQGHVTWGRFRKVTM